jgi:hypothetical protein
MSYFSFTKSENRRAEQVLPGVEGFYQWEGGEDVKRVWEGEYSTNSVYICM